MNQSERKKDKTQSMTARNGKNIHWGVILGKGNSLKNDLKLVQGASLHLPV